MSGTRNVVKAYSKGSHRCRGETIDVVILSAHVKLALKFVLQSTFGREGSYCDG